MPPSGCSTDSKAVSRFIHLHSAAGKFSGEQMRGQRITDLLFNGVTHRARTEFGVKSFADKKWQDCFVQFEFVAAHRKKFNFSRQKLLGYL
jgi:hypothetical protein